MDPQEPAPASSKETLHRQVARLYEWIIAWATSAEHRARTKDAQDAFSRETNWDDLLPHERARIVDLLLSSYMQLWSSAPAKPFDWETVKYRDLLKMVGVMGGQRVRHEVASTTFERIKLTVDAIGRACTGLPAAQTAFATWKATFIGRAGITRVKLRRIEQLCRGELVRRFENAAGTVLQFLHAARFQPDMFPSADELFAQAHAASQQSTKRFTDFILFAEDLDKLYRAHIAQREPNEAYLEQLDDLLATLRHGRLAVHFGGLSIERQLAALKRGREILFAACQEVKRAQRLPNPAQRISDLCDALDWPPAQGGVAAVAAGPSHQPPSGPFARPSHSRASSSVQSQPNVLSSPWPVPTPHHSYSSPPQSAYYHPASLPHGYAFSSPAATWPGPPSSQAAFSPTTSSFPFPPASSPPTQQHHHYQHAQSPTWPEARSPRVPPPWLQGPVFRAHPPPHRQPQPGSSDSRGPWGGVGRESSEGETTRGAGRGQPRRGERR